MAGLCPYPDHDEKTPSFSVAPDRGFYYCFGCLEANERIWTSRGLIPVAAAEVGDEVIGVNGRRETITDKWFKSGTTLKITTGAAREGIALTPDHTCVFVRREDALRSIPGVHLRSSRGKEVRFSSRLRRDGTRVRISTGPASEVRAGDLWLYPVVPDGERNAAPLTGERAIKPNTKGPRTARIPSLPVNPDAAWLYGVWLAEGSLYRGGVKWSFGTHEENTLAEKVIHTLDEQFGRSAGKFVRPERSLCEVACSSTDLAALFGRWFGSGCEHKRIPFEALYWPRECQQALVDGYMDGDGRFAGGIHSAMSVSEELAYGIFALCIQAGRVCSTTSRPARTGNDGVRRRKCYQLNVLSKESMKGFFATIDGERFFLSVVQQIVKASDHPTSVVDITTTGSHTFLTKMGVTHNCQRGGDAIKLVMDLKNLPFGEAVSYLADRSSVELHFEGSAADSDAARKRSLRRRAIHKALAAAAVYYHKTLLKGATGEAREAHGYLKDRGFTDSTIEEFRLGYAPPRGGSGFVEAAGRLGLGRDVLEAAGLLSGRGGERFAGRVTFPISDVRGRILGFGARALGDDHPKYLNSPETEVFNKRELLYGFPQVGEAMRKERAALVVEGYTDVLMLYQSGIKNAVATLGTATTPAHLKILGRSVDTVTVLFDPDAAGYRAAERIVEDEDLVLAASGLRLDFRLLRLTEDPADWLKEHTTEEFEALLGGAVPVLEFVIRRIAEEHRGGDAVRRSRAVPRMKRLIGRIDDPVLRREAIRLATEALGVGAAGLADKGGGSTGGRLARERPRVTDPHERAGREVLAIALARPRAVRELIQAGIQTPDGRFSLAPEDFATQTQAMIFARLREAPDADLSKLFGGGQAHEGIDELFAIQSDAETITREDLYATAASAREAWLRLGILRRQRDMRSTPDLDAKARLQTELANLKAALRDTPVHP